MLAPDKKVPISEGSPVTRTESVNQSMFRILKPIYIGNLENSHHMMRFVTLVKQSQELKTVSYHKLYDILNQHQNEVNEIRAERIARTANPLALVAQQQPDKGIVISELKKLIEKLKRKYVDTKFGKSLVIRQSNAFKSQRQSILGKPTIFSDSLKRNDFSKSKSVTQNNVSNDFSKPVTAQTLPPNKKSILQNTNVLAPEMYKLQTEPTQTRTSQLPQDSRKTNKRVSFSTGVIPTTSVSRPQLKSNPMGDTVMRNNSQRKKQDVEDHRYSTQSRAYRVFSKRTRVIVETIHVNFDELPQMASDHVSSDLTPEYRTVITSNELDLLFSPMFDELLNGSSKVVTKSSTVSTADAPNQRQQHTTPLNTHTTPTPTCQVPTQLPSVESPENMNQAEMVEEYAQVENDEFINIFCTPVQDKGETLSRHIDLSNMHTFYQHYPSEHRWTKDHPLEQVIGNPSQS
nr:hypothetical protein [Tanacetum cinerariifolium]